MRYFFDAEFLERPNTIDIISIGVVAEDGREYYCENSLFDWRQCDPAHINALGPASTRETRAWLWDNVYPHLGSMNARKLPVFIGQDIKEFVGDDPDPQFWGWYADYDWVVFCWLQGRMIDLPKGWPKYCRDLKQVADQLGVKIPNQSKDNREHHALADARDLKLKFEWVQHYLRSNKVEKIDVLA